MKNEFYSDIAELFTTANVPLDKLNYPIFDRFFARWCGKNCPDPSTLRKSYLEPLYDDAIQRIRKDIDNHWIYLQIDEARICDRNIYLIVVGKLDGCPSQPFLLDCKEIPESANNVSATQAIVDALKILWPEKILYDNLRLLLSDQAAYMIRAGENLKRGLFPHLLHVTCLCHGLSRVCEETRIAYPKVERVITYLTNVLARAPRRVALLEEITNCKVQSFPVATRWGTYVKFCRFVYVNFESILQFTERILDEDCASIGLLLSWINEEKTRDDLRQIMELQKLPEAIAKLETRNLTIHEQKKLVDEVREALPERFVQKLDSSLMKNPDYAQIFSLTGAQKRKFEYAPLTSVEVERLFSQLKGIVNDQRNRLSEVSVKRLAIVYCNSNKV